MKYQGKTKGLLGGGSLAKTEGPRCRKWRYFLQYHVRLKSNSNAPIMNKMGNSASYEPAVLKRLGLYKHPTLILLPNCPNDA